MEKQNARCSDIDEYEVDQKKLFIFSKLSSK
jgi:hypothetical protein